MADTAEATEGYFVLSWSIPVLAIVDNDPDLQLQQSLSSAFTQSKSISVSPSGNLTLTGFPDGEYFFRVGDGVAWSELVNVRVRHHGLGQALMFFMTGFVLFLILLGVIATGVRRENIDNG